VVVGVVISVVRVITWFLVCGQLMRSRSAQAVRVMRVALISSRRFIVLVALVVLVRLFLRVLILALWFRLLGSRAMCPLVFLCCSLVMPSYIRKWPLYL